MTVAAERMLVVALDIGTSFSGYAFSLRDSSKSALNTTVHLNSKWECGSQLVVNEKVPSCILIHKDRHICPSFGYDAQQKYARLADEGKRGGWYFFENFKMQIYEKSLTKETEIKDINGNCMTALEVFSFTIRFLKDHCINVIRRRLPEVDEEKDVSFVITVPSIWNDAAKEMMREASLMAGIDGDLLRLCEEPLAAALCCQTLKASDLECSTKCTISRIGSKFMVIDNGGGTVDITTYERNEDGKLKELCKAGGGPWGGIAVNKKFRSLLQDVFGEQVFEQLKTEQMEEYFDLCREIEDKKKVVRTKTDEELIIKLPALLVEKCEQRSGNGVQYNIQNSGHRAGMRILYGKLRLSSNIVRSLFDESVQSIVDYVDEFLSKAELHIPLILLVGGYSASPHLREAFTAKFGEKRSIVVPVGSINSTCVLKGAVLYGLDPSLMESRILRFTYGVEYKPCFDQRMHPDANKAEFDGEIVCNQAFRVYMKAGERVENGYKQSFQFWPNSRSDTVAEMKIYSSLEPDPILVTEPSCRLITSYTVPLPPYVGRRRRIEQEFEFQDAEIVITAVVEDVEVDHRTRIPFLG